MSYSCVFRLNFLRVSLELLQETRRAPQHSSTPLQRGGTCAAHGILPRSSQESPKMPSWRRLGRQLRSLGALLATLGRSWALLGALGTLLERSWNALGRSWALLEALARSWEPLGTLLSALGRLVGHSWVDLGTSQGRFWALHSYFKSFLSNPSGEDSESRPKAIQERSEMIPKTKSSSAG